jgi:hypothetical protein
MFQSGSHVKGKDFIDRKKHLPLFKSYLDNNQHIMIKADDEIKIVEGK